MALHNSTRIASMLSSTRRQFMAASSAAVFSASASRSIAAGRTDPPASTTAEAIHFPRSYLYCSPQGSGIWVRVQMECRGTLTDTTTGQTDEYVMGVVAKTGLSTDSRSGKPAPGYDYWIIFSPTHVFTKRSHSSVYINNPTVLEHKDFGDAKWRLHKAAAQPLRSAAEIRDALKNWRELSAKTTFYSADRRRQFSVEYPIKWADYGLKSDAFRVETGPVFLLNPDERRVGEVPSFDDFQWAHFDYHDFANVRCLLEQPTSVLADLTFTPPEEHGRQFRANPGLSETQVEDLRRAAFEAQTGLSNQMINSILSTDHYSQAKVMPATTEVYALAE